MQLMDIESSNAIQFFKEFGGWLQSQRKALGLTQRAAAKKIGMSDRQWSHYEKGGGVRPETINRLLNALNLNASAVQELFPRLYFSAYRERSTQQTLEATPGPYAVTLTIEGFIANVTPGQCCERILLANLAKLHQDTESQNQTETSNCLLLVGERSFTSIREVSQMEYSADGPFGKIKKVASKYFEYLGQHIQVRFYESPGGVTLTARLTYTEPGGPTPENIQMYGDSSNRGAVTLIEFIINLHQFAKSGSLFNFSFKNTELQKVYEQKATQFYNSIRPVVVDTSTFISILMAEMKATEKLLPSLPII